MPGLDLARNVRMEKNMETAIMGHRGTTRRIHSFIPSQPKTPCLAFLISFGLRFQGSVFGGRFRFRVCWSRVRDLHPQSGIRAAECCLNGMPPDPPSENVVQGGM